MAGEISDFQEGPQEIRQILDFVAHSLELREAGPELAGRQKYWESFSTQLLQAVAEGHLSVQQAAEINSQLLAYKEWLSDHDPLTGLYNRRGFDEFLAREMEEASRLGHNVALVLIDLDLLRKINKLGHLQGDVALKAVAQAIKDNLISGGLGGRMGGDEFAIAIPGLSLESARVFAQNIWKAVGQNPSGIKNRNLSVSIGVGVWPAGSNESPADFCNRIDKGPLALAKKNGRNQVMVDEKNG